MVRDANTDNGLTRLKWAHKFRSRPAAAAKGSGPLGNSRLPAKTTTAAWVSTGSRFGHRSPSGNGLAGRSIAIWYPRKSRPLV